MVATSVLLVFCAFQSAGPIEPRIELTAKAEALPRADLSVDVPLVLIPVHVTTPLGASVPNLPKSSFHLFENGVEQTITHFSSEDAPLSIGFLFDASGSMRNKLRKSAEAAAAFFRTANTDDEFFLIDFNERPRLAIPFTQNAGAITRHIAHTHADGRTSLLDAIHLALEQMEFAKNLRKAIVIVSDGGDNRSRYTETEIKSALREADVQLYAMGIFDPDESPKRTPEERNGPKLLDELAEQTGGRHYPVQNLDELASVCERIGRELRNEYLIGYAPANDAQDGTYRKVKVTVTPPSGMPELRAHHRQGYYAPALFGR
ncbi:MAG TPA: VWA domain-containing protein [Bryobacteraceae bacterium]|nr:VWA domain-containing protein [Bryobacteraceae bacterium]